MVIIGLRQRKKTETRRAIAAAALALAVERGPDRVTVDDIAAAAGVSPRTVFNHFGTKDEAILGIDEQRRAEIVAQVAARPTHEPSVAALGAVLVQLLTSTEEVGDLWVARARLVADHPQLRAAQTVAHAALEHELTAVVAARLGVDATYEPYPALVVTAVLAAVRVTLERTAGAGRHRLRRELERSLTILRHGLDR